MQLSLANVSLRVGQFSLQDISFAVPAGEMFVILGPNGAGKSVLMELIAGFYRPQSGSIELAGQEISQLAPERRKIGFVFQNYALFPHLTVAQNIQFALRLAKDHSKARLEELLQRFALAHLAQRKPQVLSGGEKQRVALARALAMQPALFLFDEPFAAVDERSRGELGAAIKQMLAETGIPALFVTHDQMEAQALADHVAVMQQGRIIQAGPSAQVFNAPANEFVARFTGAENVLEAQVLSLEGNTAVVMLGETPVATAPLSRAVVPGQAVKLCIRPENIVLQATEGAAPGTVLQARVAALYPWGPVWKVSLDCGVNLMAYALKHEVRQLEVGQAVRVLLLPGALHVLPG